MVPKTMKDEDNGEIEQDGPSFTARIKGEGYDLQVCTDEPLTDEERAALHEFLQDDG